MNREINRKLNSRFERVSIAGKITDIKYQNTTRAEQLESDQKWEQKKSQQQLDTAHSDLNRVQKSIKDRQTEIDQSVKTIEGLKPQLAETKLRVCRGGAARVLLALRSNFFCLFFL